ncbi:SCAN domain-containing protein 3 [Anthophora plagiata]
MIYQPVCLQQLFVSVDLNVSDYPALANKALQHLIQFCTTYLCEQAFSVLLYVKSKYRNKLNVEADLRIKLFNIERDILVLVSRKQLHPSH